jgi:hypothetical protein
LGLLASVAILSFGCATQDRSVEDAIDSGPLPYHVGLFLEEFRAGPESPAGPADVAGSEELEANPAEASVPQEGGGNGGGEVGEPTEPNEADSETGSPPGPSSDGSSTSVESPVQFVIPPSAFLSSLADALDGESGIVAKATPIDAENREAAVANARRLLCDKVLILSFETDPEYRELSRPAGWVTLEIVCWLFGGIPAWFVPTVHFDTHTRLVVEGIDLTSPASPSTNGASGDGADAPSGPSRLADWRVSLPCDPQGTSLWDRSDPLDRPLEYVSTIVVPPLIHAPGTPDRVSAEISGEVQDELAGRLRELARERLSSELLNPTCAAVFVSPDPRESTEGESIRLRLGIANRGPARIVAMDVSRIVKGGTVVRWQATAEDLQTLSTAIGSGEDPLGYALFDVPREFPLGVGENYFKVRILREDRVMSTSSMRYVR